jgi:hypothetical protein
MTDLQSARMRLILLSPQSVLKQNSLCDNKAREALCGLEFQILFNNFPRSSERPITYSSALRYRLNQRKISTSTAITILLVPEIC